MINEDNAMNKSYRFIGIVWLLHTGSDVAHRLHGSLIIPFSATSSLGCAICDPVIAAWCLLALLRFGIWCGESGVTSRVPLEEDAVGILPVHRRS